MFGALYLYVSVQAKWIPPPMAFIGELFEHAAPHEVYQLLSAVNTYLKVGQVLLCY